MEFIGKLERVDRSFISDDYTITFSTPELPSGIEAVADRRLQIKAGPFRRKRSLDSNAYAWLLISKIADILHTTKEEIYGQMLQRYGQPQVDEMGQAVLITVLSKVDVGKYGIYAKKIDSGILNGKEFTSYMVLRGSSTYDTKEMSIFVDGVVSDAEELGIDTVPRVELEKMKAKWHL